MKTFNTIAIAMLAFGLGGRLSAQSDPVFAYYDNSPLSLGRSVDIRTPLESKEPPFEGAPEGQWVDGAKIEFRMTLNTTAGSVSTTADFDLALAGEAEFGFSIISGGGSSNKHVSTWKNRVVTDDSVILTIEARTDFGRKMLGARTLTATAQELLAKDKPAFTKRYGTHYVTSQRHAASMAVHIKVTDLSQTLKENIKADYSSKFNANWLELVKGSISVTGHFYKFLDTARKNGSLTVEFDSVGVSPALVTGIPAPTADSLNLRELLNGMESILKGFTREDSHPVRFQLASFANLDGESIPLDPERRRFFEQAFQMGVSLDASLEILNAQIDTLSRARTAEASKLRAQLLGLHQKYLLEKERLTELVRRAKETSDFKAVVEAAELEGVYAFTNPFIDAVLEPKPDYKDSFLDSLSLVLQARLRHPAVVDHVELFKELPGVALPREMLPLALQRQEDRLYGRIDDFHVKLDGVNKAEGADKIFDEARQPSYFLIVKFITGDTPVRYNLPAPNLTGIRSRRS